MSAHGRDIRGANRRVAAQENSQGPAPGLASVEQASLETLIL